MPDTQRASGKPDRFWAIAAAGGASFVALLALFWQLATPTAARPPAAAPSASTRAPDEAHAPAEAHEHAHVHTPRSARPEGSTRPPRDTTDEPPEITAATESAKSANANRNPRENVPEPHEVVRMLDGIIARLDGEIAAARAAKDTAKVRRLEVRLARLQRDRERQLAQADGGPPAPPPADLAAPSGDPP